MGKHDMHSCSYYCMRPACILAQRNELRYRMLAVSENAAQGAENGSGTPANIAGLGNPPAAAPACPDGADTLLRKAVGDVERIPEYFQKPGIVEKLSEVHPVLLVRQMAHEILRLRAHLSGKDRT